MPIKNPRAKGAKLELDIIKIFKELGWTEACSSRSESKRLDDSGVDVCYTHPFQIQAKANEKLGPAHPILATMPKKNGMFNLVWHKKNRQGSVVTMTESDFVILVKLLIDSGSIKPC